MIIRNGSPEHITKSLKYGYASGNRPAESYIVMVHVAGDDTYEVGLSALRKCLGGLRRLTPEQTHILTKNKPESITFTGTCTEHHNDLQITMESAAEWADKVKGLI